MNDSSVKRSLDKGDEYFKQWSTEKDPDGKTWQYVGEYQNPKTKRLGKYFSLIKGHQQI